MKPGIKLTVRLLLYIAILVLSVACAPERENNTPGNSHVQATFNMNIPGANTMSTRALTENDEYKVINADVLVFDKTDGKFLYAAYPLGTVQQPNNLTAKFLVKLREVEGVTRYDFMILANARHIIAAHYPSGIPSNGSIGKEDIRMALKDAITAGTGWINNSSDAGYKHMPMWGELKDHTIASKSYSASLTRMTAKIDLRIALAGASPNDSFVMQEVWLYNYNTQGYFIPDPANWGVPSPNPDPSKTHERALAPSVEALTINTATPIDYSAAIAPDGKSLLNSIYTFEAATRLGADINKNMCVVIKASWKPAGGTEQIGWYRMDFANTDQAMLTTKYIPIKRNHKYEIKIVSVNGKGYGSREEAYGSLPVNIVSEVTEFDENSVGASVTDGQYTLGVSQTAYTLSREGRDGDDACNRLKVITNYVNPTIPSSSGWKAALWEDEGGTTPISNDAVTGQPWISLSQDSGTGNYPSGDNIYFKVSENRSNTTRVAWAHIRAGRMLIKVKVEQGVAVDLMVALRDPVSMLEQHEYIWLVTPDAEPEDFIFDLVWSPKIKDVSVSNAKKLDTSSSLFLFDNTSGYDNISEGTSTVTGGTGIKSYKIRPPKISAAALASDQLYDKSSVIEYTVKSGVYTVKKQLTLRQVYFNLIPEGFDDGGARDEITAKIKSNTDWVVEVTQGASLLEGGKPITENGTGNTAGTDFKYKFSGDYALGSITFTFKSPQGLFPDVLVTVNKQKVAIASSFARSNIVLKDGKLTFAVTRADNAQIPANSQGLHFKFGSLVGVSSTGTHGTSFSASHVVFSPSEYSKPTTWSGIPYFSSGSTSSLYVDVLKEAYPDTGYNASTGIGDICRYISDKGWVEGRWRLPTASEYQLLYDETTVTSSGYKGLSFGTFQDIIIGTNDGTTAMPSGWFFGAALAADMGNASNAAAPPGGTVFFPAAGYRSYPDYNGDGTLYNSGDAGYYWSSSIYSSTYGYFLKFHRTAVDPTNGDYRKRGFSVRCIKDN